MSLTARASLRADRVRQDQVDDAKPDQHGRKQQDRLKGVKSCLARETSFPSVFGNCFVQSDQDLPAAKSGHHPSGLRKAEGRRDSSERFPPEQADESGSYNRLSPFHPTRNRPPACAALFARDRYTQEHHRANWSGL